MLTPYTSLGVVSMPSVLTPYISLGVVSMPSVLVPYTSFWFVSMVSLTYGLVGGVVELFPESDAFCLPCSNNNHCSIFTTTSPLNSQITDSIVDINVKCKHSLIAGYAAS